MSEQQHDADPGFGPAAQPTVDILPVQGGRKTRPAGETPPPTPTPADPAWAQPGSPADAASPALNPWTGVSQALAPTQLVDYPAPPAPPAPYEPAVQAPVQALLPAPIQAPTQPQTQVPAPVQVPAGATWPQPTVQAVLAPAPVPVFPGVLAAPDPSAQVSAIPPGAEPAAAAVPAKRFLGMQLRRPRRDSSQSEPADQPMDGPVAPVAAWPTDVGMTVVADAEPATAHWAAPVAFGPVDTPPIQPPLDFPPPMHAPVADTPPVQAPVADTPPVQAPVADTPPVQVPAPSAPVAGPQPFAFPGPAAAPPVAEPAPVAVTPVPQPADDEELRGLRTVLETSEARRAAAEQRADQAVAYGQQLQAELSRVSAELEGRLKAAEVQIRTSANEIQDWKIRHREAEAQIAELASSVGGAEQRLFEMRVERDELMVALDEATNPNRADIAEQLSES